MATAVRREEYDSRPGESGSTFRSFAVRLTAGEDHAAADLVARYSARLVALARQGLSPALRAKCDPEDVLQSVFRTFFRRLGTGDVDLRDWESLAGLLALLTVRKCQHRVRHYRTAGRDVRLEVRLDGADGGPIHVPDRDPVPDEIAAFTELAERLLQSLNLRDREVISRVIAGEGTAEIAQRLGRTRRAVQRAIARTRQRLLAQGLG
jgi:RNA polymerase sigma-70 factor (ECF subfamily)